MSRSLLCKIVSLYPKQYFNEMINNLILEIEQLDKFMQHEYNQFFKIWEQVLLINNTLHSLQGKKLPRKGKVNLKKRLLALINKYEQYENMNNYQAVYTCKFIACGLRRFTYFVQ